MVIHVDFINTHNSPNSVYRDRTAVSAVCSCTNKHGTCDGNGFASLWEKKEQE